MALKRSFADAGFQSVEDHQDVTMPALMTPDDTPCTDCMATSMATSVPVECRETSPLSSTLSSLTRENSASPAVPKSTGNHQPPPPKRRKLTFAEKEVLRIEKQFKDQQKADEKARREEERRIKEEERRTKEEDIKEAKRKREEEREQKKRLRDAEKQARDEEKRKRDAEKKAKEDEKAKKEKVRE